MLFFSVSLFFSFHPAFQTFLLTHIPSHSQKKRILENPKWRRVSICIFLLGALPRFSHLSIKYIHQKQMLRRRVDRYRFMSATAGTWNLICRLAPGAVRLVEFTRQLLLALTPQRCGWGSYSLLVYSGRAQGVCRWCGTQSALICFLHLFLQQDPEHSWSRAGCQGRRWLEPAVSAQPWFGLMRWLSLAAPPSLSCGHNDASPTTSSILVNLDRGVSITSQLFRHI